VLALVDELPGCLTGLFARAAVAVEQDADLDALRHVVRSVKAIRLVAAEGVARVQATGDQARVGAISAAQ
jgi:hypothetical protein